MADELNDNLKKHSTWERIFYMLVLAVIVSMIVSPLLWAVVLLQIITTLVIGQVNAHILAFGRKLSTYLYHITLYLTFNSEAIPFPFSSWQATEQFDAASQQTHFNDLS